MFILFRIKDIEWKDDDEEEDEEKIIEQRRQKRLELLVWLIFIMNHEYLFHNSN